MLTPADKLNSGGNRIIQIVVTRKCDLFYCSNCTQLLPFRRDAVEMTPDVFRAAIRSLSGWPGTIAMFGGNPCTHSAFPELCRIMREEVPNVRQRGLWTNNFLGHGKVIQETFQYGVLNLNVHGDTAAATQMRRWLPERPIYGETGRDHHGPMLLDYRDYGITDRQWAFLRERCDVNRNWSAAIMQRDTDDGPAPFVYFCEVAGSLDGIRGENHGLRASAGWWRLPISEFEQQISQCCDRGCGVPLRRQGHQDQEDTYDVSPSMTPLTVRGRGLGGKLKLRVCDDLPPESHEFTDYIGLRIGKA